LTLDCALDEYASPQQIFIVAWPLKTQRPSLAVNLAREQLESGLTPLWPTSSARLRRPQLISVDRTGLCHSGARGPWLICTGQPECGESKARWGRAGGEATTAIPGSVQGTMVGRRGHAGRRATSWAFWSSA